MSTLTWFKILRPKQESKGSLSYFVDDLLEELLQKVVLGNPPR